MNELLCVYTTVHFLFHPATVRLSSTPSESLCVCVKRENLALVCQKEKKKSILKLKDSLNLF